MRILILVSTILFVLISIIYADIFILKTEQVVEGSIIQETDKIFIIRKTDQKTGAIRKENIAYQIPDMSIQELLVKARNYINRNEYNIAYYFYLAAESRNPRDSDILEGLVRCLIARKEYDRAYAKVKYALLWKRTTWLEILLAEIHTNREEFDNADEILLRLKKQNPQFNKIIDEYLKNNQQARKIAEDKARDKDSNAFNSEFGNCKDAADNAILLLNWSRETDERTFISAELKLVTSGKHLSSFTDVQTLRNNVHTVECKMIVDKDRFSNDTVFSEKDRKINVLGWYFYLRKIYEKALNINIEILYEFVTPRNETRRAILAKAYWATKGEKIIIQYIR